MIFFSSIVSFLFSSVHEFTIRINSEIRLTIRFDLWQRFPWSKWTTKCGTNLFLKMASEQFPRNYNDVSLWADIKCKTNIFYFYFYFHSIYVYHYDSFSHFLLLLESNNNNKKTYILLVLLGFGFCHHFWNIS